MSRFADLAATDTVDLGACQCPGTPHESDWAKVRTSLSFLDLVAYERMEQYSDQPHKIAETLAPFVTEWNLLGPDGLEWEPDADAIFLLGLNSVTPLLSAIGDAVVSSADVPKASGAPSPASSRGSASRTRAPSRRRGT